MIVASMLGGQALSRSWVGMILQWKATGDMQTCCRDGCIYSLWRVGQVRSALRGDCLPHRTIMYGYLRRMSPWLEIICVRE